MEVLDTLSAVPDDQLDRVARDSGVFLDRRWLRMVESLDLDAIVGGQVSLRFVAVRAGPELRALCPFIVTRSASVYSFYSLDRFYFTAWRDELLALHPDQAPAVSWLARAVMAYRWLARLSGASTRGWVLGVSPLSHHFDIAAASDCTARRSALQARVVGALKDVARDEDLPLGLLGVRDEQLGLREVLHGQDFAELFLMYDSVIPLPDGDFDDYLGRFSSQTRQRFKREMRRARSAGVRFDIVGDLRGLEGDLAALYEAMYGQYGTDRFRHPAPFWSDLGRDLAGRAEILLAWHDRRPVAFTALLRKGGDLHAWRGGRTTGGDLARVPLYFSQAIYEPVKRALHTGARRLWLGPGCWDAKLRRGAVPHACYSHLWFPRRWPRHLLMPYLNAFSAVSRREQTAALTRSPALA